MKLQAGNDRHIVLTIVKTAYYQKILWSSEHRGPFTIISNSVK